MIGCLKQKPMRSFYTQYSHSQKQVKLEKRHLSHWAKFFVWSAPLSSPKCAVILGKLTTTSKTSTGFQIKTRACLIQNSVCGRNSLYKNALLGFISLTGYCN